MMKTNSKLEVAKATARKTTRLTMSSFADSKVFSLNNTGEVKAPLFSDHMAASATCKV